MKITLTNKEIDKLRDIATKYEDYDFEVAKLLMGIAHRARPHGPYILSKLNQYKTLSTAINYNSSIKDEIPVAERIDYYIGKGLSYPIENLKQFIKNEDNSSNKNKYIDALCLYRQDIFRDKPIIGTYKKDINQFLELFDYKNYIPVLFGDDIKGNYSIPVFKKARRVNDINGGIILKLNAIRHFANIGSDPMSWSEKIDDVVWRGVSTGERAISNKRFLLVKKYSHKYNIAFNRIMQKNDFFWTKNLGNLNCFIKESISVFGQLKYKYIISIEGNDVATNLKWILASNSVPIMPKPTVESWIMESKLIPYKHYVPLNDNLDNLDEVLQWCRDNDDKCRDIAENGKRYMNMFFN